MKQLYLWLGAVAIAVIVCSGCAHKGGAALPAATDTPPGAETDYADADPDEFPDQDMLPEPDPLAFWNRAVFVFNDTFYFAVLKPVASAYRALVPEPARQGVKNFFHNVSGPARMINCIIQGKGAAAQAEWVRWWMNTTVGVLGLGNPAGRFEHLNPPAEDFGQSLGVYGVGEGWYIIWPVLGPSNLRDTVGMAADRFLHPSTYIEPVETALGLSALETVNRASFRIGDYESLKDAAIEPYEAFRDAYSQYRKKQLNE